MSEKGTIRRFNSLNSTPSSQIQPYSQTQKHLEKFLKLIANELNEMGIKLKEARVIEDEKKIISEYYQRCFGEDLPESSINVSI